MTSLYKLSIIFQLPGNHASRSSFFAAALFKAPEQIHTILNYIITLNTKPGSWRGYPSPAISKTMKYMVDKIQWEAKTDEFSKKTLNLYDMPSTLQRFSALLIIWSMACQEASSWGDVITNCSTFSNWWTRKIPRVSLPWDPTSCLKTATTM